MPRLSRRLLLLPFLLLVPLGVLKWRADWVQDHPPVSTADRLVRRAMSRVSRVQFYGYDPQWGALSGLKQNQTVAVRDPTAFHTFTEVLRCSDQTVKLGEKPSNGPASLSVDFSVHTSDVKRPWRSFFYWRNAQGAYLWPYNDTDGFKDTGFVVNPRFAPRFEALIAQLAKRAKAPGQHPEVILK